MKTRLGPLETRLLAYAQLRRQTLLRRGSLARELRLTPDQEAALLSRLARAGLIARVRAGVYLVPATLPLGGAWSPSEGLALNALMREYGASYQVCGPNCFDYYDYDDDNQIPNRVYAYNDKLSGTRRVGSINLVLVKVAKARLGDTETVRDSDGVVTPYSSRVRTLVDAVYDWSRFQSLPRAFDWIAADLKSRKIATSRLVDCTLKFGDVATLRRMGALLERQRAAPKLLARLDRSLRSTTATIPWIPGRPKRGRIDRRWGVVWNDDP
ncbi:MAG TPA: hypothetical protein VFY71_19025 [Planctomycetota bacterium]|nr:hypothetical protein [Planctomycetota bacterium]